MTTVLSQKTFKAEPGREYRFIVKSAEEAVSTIREKLGAQAKVLSVKQMDGKGLTRFLSSPKLEVIAKIPLEERAGVQVSLKQEIKKPDPSFANNRFDGGDEIPDYMQERDELDEMPAYSKAVFQKRRKIMDGILKYPEGDIGEDHFPQISRSINAGAKLNQTQIVNILKKIGFSETLISRLENSDSWERFHHLSFSRALIELIDWISENYAQLKHRPVTNRIAFLGAPGVGKTTALCKRLTQDVFMRNERINVIKLESNTPNSDDALKTFCEVLNVPLLRDPLDLSFLKENALTYLDLPGLRSTDHNDIQLVKDRLDYLKVDTRVLVINAAYQPDVIKDHILLGDYFEATHYVFTHIDEVNNPSSLWPLIFQDIAAPFFITNGPSITSEYEEDVLNQLLKKTFPRKLLGR